jgi:DNA polymerase-1
MSATLCLIDGHALAYRAYFALTVGSAQGAPATRWVTSKGESTAGVYGFTSILLRILEQERFDYIAVAFDTGRTFRHEIYAAYKATRAKMPDELRPQIERIRQIVDAFNMPRLEVEGYEADDVLGSVSAHAAREDLGVKIFTGDRDLLQLVSDHIIVNLPGKSLSDSKDYYSHDVEASLGVRPDQVVDMKALMGDKSDNIPGVPGIGEKTSISLLKTYDTLDGIYDHLTEIPGAVQKKLEQGRQSALLSRKLATIVTDLDIPFDIDKARTEHFDPAHVESLFRELEFRTLLKRFQTWAGQVQGYTPASTPGETAPSQQLTFLSADRPPLQAAERPESGGGTPTPAPARVAIVDSTSALQDLAKRLAAADHIAFDTETTGTDPMRAELVGISLAVKTGEGYYIPILHRLDEDKGRCLPSAAIVEALRPALTNPAIPKYGHNAKYDYVVLKRYGIEVSPITFDTMIAEWLINPDSRNLGLKRLAWVRLNMAMTEIEELIGKGKNQRTMDFVPIHDAAPYAVADVDSVLYLVPGLQVEMEKAIEHPPSPDHPDSSLVKIFNEIEMPLLPILADMEMAGITLDTPFLKNMSNDLQKRLSEIEGQVFQTVGRPFNLNSPQQLSHALFDVLQLKMPGRTRRTASGAYSTNAEVLEGLRGQHPIIEWILEHREIAKLRSTYIESLPMQIDPATGRVHTSYNQTGSVTGRISSSDPNLQNIPIRTELGKQVRRAFIASPGHLIVSVDYSQVELRIVAHMAKDEAMIAAFNAGQDIHAATAAAIFNVPLDQVTKDQRRHAKAVNFGLIYGMSAFGLTRSSDLTLAEAEDFVATYFKRFPAIKKYLDQIRQQAAHLGYVETLFGRRRYFPTLKINAQRAGLSREEREAINAPIQGTAADIIKIAMTRLPDALHKAKLASQLLLQVHDELVLECPKDELSAAVRLVRSVMENACTLSVPLGTEARYGVNWGEMQVFED